MLQGRRSSSSRPSVSLSTTRGSGYCHWKSNESLDRSASGENDLDLLVLRSDARRFEGILRDLGFRDAQLPRWKELPGVYHSYGVDRRSGHFVHIHAHYQLVIGDDMTKNYHLPIEAAYLASARPVTPFLVPAPEFELGLFSIRMVIKHCTWDAFLTFQSSLSKSERRELDDLVAQGGSRGRLGPCWAGISPLSPPGALGPVLALGAAGAPPCGLASGPPAGCKRSSPCGLAGHVPSTPP